MAKKLTSPRLNEKGIPTDARPIRTYPAGTGWRPKKSTTKQANIELIHAQWFNQMNRDKSILYTRDIT